MTPSSREALPVLFLLGIPVVGAWVGWGPGFALLGVAVGLVALWGTRFSRLGRPPPEHAPLVLDSIGASHYCEMLRWHLDRLGVPYRERKSVGVLGLFLLARTVPRLLRGDGASRVAIGDSREALRYLWGRYGVSHPKLAAFLAPTTESLELEPRLDAYAVDLRHWLYSHLVEDRELLLQFWGVDDPEVPGWQRATLRALFPLVRAFLVRGLAITPESIRASVARAEALLDEMEDRLIGGGPVMRRGPLHSIDLQLAAFSGLWVGAPEYGGREAASYHVADAALPAALREELAAWRDRYPRTVAYVRRLYEEQRGWRPTGEF